MANELSGDPPGRHANGTTEQQQPAPCASTRGPRRDRDPYRTRERVRDDSTDPSGRVFRYATILVSIVSAVWLYGQAIHV